MKKSKFTEEQIAFALCQVGSGSDCSALVAVPARALLKNIVDN